MSNDKGFDYVSDNNRLWHGWNVGLIGVWQGNDRALVGDVTKVKAWVDV
jgi:hypothetical protein